MQTFKLIASAACVTAFLSACSSTPTNTANNNSTAGQNDSRKVATLNAADRGGAEMDKHSVYFDFDSYVLRDDGKTIVTANANSFAKKPHKITVQGNTDERGGAEYNLALGQRRAEAVKKSLVLLGVPDKQIEAVSFGKEKPKASGHDESSWSQNRRADIVY